MFLSIWNSISWNPLSLSTVLTSQIWKLIHKDKVKKVSRGPNADFHPRKIRFPFEADGCENAAGSHAPRLSPLLKRRHLVEGMRSGAVAFSKFTSAPSAAVEEIKKIKSELTQSYSCQVNPKLTHIQKCSCRLRYLFPVPPPNSLIFSSHLPLALSANWICSSVIRMFPSQRPPESLTFLSLHVFHNQKYTTDFFFSSFYSFIYLFITFFFACLSPNPPLNNNAHIQLRGISHPLSL